MKKWLTKDICSGTVLLLFSAWWLWGAEQIKVREMDGSMAADFMPKLLGGLLLVLSAIQVLRGIYQVWKNTYQAKESRNVHWKTVCLALALAVYCLCLDHLGFLLCTGLFLFGCMSALCDPKEGKKKDLMFFLRYLVMAVIITVLMHLIFVVAFKITLPVFSLMD